MVTVRWPYAGVGLLAVTAMLLAGCQGDKSAESTAATATAPVPSAPPVSGDPVIGQPVFNDPNSQDPAERGAILLQLARLIAGVPRGGTIEMSMHQFDIQHSTVEKQIVRELVDRARHGVRVRVLMDGTNLGAKHAHPDHAVRSLRGGFKGTHSWVATCSDRTPSKAHRGCIGSRANHNKFALFSSVRAGGKRYDNVVFQSSSNISDFYTTKSWNDSFTARDAKLYAGYREYFDDLLKGRKQRSVSGYDVYWPTPYSREVDGSSGRYHAFLYPRADGKDPIIRELNRVSCTRSPTGPPGGGGALVNLAMMSFTKARKPLANKLTEMARDGCAVTIDYYPGTNDNQKNGAPAWDKSILSELRSANVILFPCRKTDLVLHTKIMTIEGYIDGRKIREVYTGSANMTSLTSFDDTWLRIADDNVAAEYARWMGNIGSRYCLPDDG